MQNALAGGNEIKALQSPPSPSRPPRSLEAPMEAAPRAKPPAGAERAPGVPTRAKPAETRLRPARGEREKVPSERRFPPP